MTAHAVRAKAKASFRAGSKASGEARPKVAVLNPRTPDLRQALDEFLLCKAAGGAAKRTMDDYRYHVGRFLQRCSDPEDYASIRKAALEYLQEATSPSTRNIRLRNLRAFFGWCVSQGYLPANPTAGVRQAKEDISGIKHVSLEAIKKLLEQPDRRTYAGLRDYCLLLVQVDTGARPGELFQLRVSDLDLAARELRVRPEAAKTRVGRTLVLSTYTAQAMARFLKARPGWWGEEVPLFATEEGKALSRHHWSRRVREYCRKAGISVTPYGLRHSFAIEFLKGGGDPFSLQRLLGHTTLATTRRYVRLTEDDIREAHEKASPVQRLAGMGKRASRRLP